MVSTVLALIAALFIGSLVVSGVAYTRQQAKERRLKKIKAYRQQANEAYLLLIFILKLDPQIELATFLHHILMSHLSNAYGLDPDDPVSAKELKNAGTIKSQIGDESRADTVNQVIETDNELRSANFQLLQISKLIEMHRNNNRLPLSQAESLLTRIQQIKLDIEIASHIHQAEAYSNNNDGVMSASHLKQVLNVLKRTPLEFDGRTVMIRTISEAIQQVKKTNKFDSSMLTGKGDPIADTGDTEEASEKSNEQVSHPPTPDAPPQAAE